MNIKALNEKRGLLVQELDTLKTALSAEKRSMTADELKRVGEIDAEITQVDDEIKALETLEKRAKKPVDFGFGGEASDGEEKELRKMADKFSISRATQLVMKGGKIDGVYAEFNDMAEQEFRSSGVAVSSSAESILIPSHLLADIAKRNSMHADKLQKRSMSVTGGSPAGSQGGYNVQTDVMGIVEVLTPFMALGNLPIQVLSGLVGNLSWPKETTDNTGGGWNTENGTATEIDPVMSQLTLSPKRFAAFIEVSKQLIAQSNNSIDAYVTNKLLMTLATRIERAFIRGGGSNEPVGILANSGVTTLFAGAAASNSTNANGAALVYKDITNLMKAVMNANATQAQFLTNFDVQASLQNTPRQGSGVEGNFILREDLSRLNARQIEYTTNVPNTLTKGTSSNLSGIICGDFSKMITGSWGGIEIVRDTMTGAKANKDTIVINAYADSILSQASAFAVIKDAVPV